MAVDAVSRELLSAKFPANREKYREYCALGPYRLAISPYERVVCLVNWRPLSESEQGSSREWAGNSHSLLRAFELSGEDPRPLVRSVRRELGHVEFREPGIPQPKVDSHIGTSGPWTTTP